MGDAGISTLILPAMTYLVAGQRWVTTGCLIPADLSVINLVLEV